MDTLTLPRPDDWHLHLRDGPALLTVTPYTAAVFGRALVMPNLVPPVRTVDDAVAYRNRILAALPPGTGFSPKMALYLTDATSPDTIRRATDHPDVLAVKLYPAGATTHADAGVTDLARLDPVFAALTDTGLPLCVHAEDPHPDVDVFDREAVFLESTLGPLLDRFPGLRVVVEHLTTADGVAFVEGAGPDVAATITPHHLLLNRNALFDGGLRPHRHCLPVLKRERHRRALVRAATSGSPRFFLGTDSAPHPRGHKESACGCAGVFNARDALGLYAEVFDAAGALDRLPGFASVHGARFYGLPVAGETITLERRPRPVPEALPFTDDDVVPFRAGGSVAWRVSR